MAQDRSVADSSGKHGWRVSAHSEQPSAAARLSAVYPTAEGHRLQVLKLEQRANFLREIAAKAMTEANEAHLAYIEESTRFEARWLCKPERAAEGVSRRLFPKPTNKARRKGSTQKQYTGPVLTEAEKQALKEALGL